MSLKYFWVLRVLFIVPSTALGESSSTRETPGSTEVMWEYKWENTDTSEVRMVVYYYMYFIHYTVGVFRAHF